MAKKDIVVKKKGEIIREARINEEEKEKNKKKFLTILILAVIGIFLLGGIVWYVTQNKTRELTDGEQFQAEYESLNNQKNSNNQKYMEVTVEASNLIQYSSYEEIFSLLENGTGVIYFGFPECPWCRNLVPVLVEAAEEAGIDALYYLNNQKDRDQKSVNKNGDIVVTKKGTEEYYQLVDRLSSVLGTYKGIDEESKRLYFPTVIFVKDGQIVDFHEGTLDSQTDASIPLTKEQRQELKNCLLEKMNKILVCDSAC